VFPPLARNLLNAPLAPVFVQLREILVRHCIDGTVTAFPAAYELKGPKAIVELLPQLSWHEDAYGNCSEGPAITSAVGEWHWPPLPHLSAYDIDRAEVDGEAPLAQLAIYRSVLEEELLPLVDATLHDLSLQRTPGTFLHQCSRLAQGQPPGAPFAGSIEALRRDNELLREQLHQLSSDAMLAPDDAHVETRQRSVLRRVQAEKEALEETTKEQHAVIMALHKQRQQRKNRQSSVCVVS
jgi:hypothetical protein